jgi:glycyl-tRNA synthetase (class II)
MIRIFRDRDRMKLVRVPVETLPEIVAALVEGTRTFASLE